MNLFEFIPGYESDNSEIISGVISARLFVANMAISKTIDALGANASDHSTHSQSDSLFPRRLFDIPEAPDPLFHSSKKETLSDNDSWIEALVSDEESSPEEEQIEGVDAKPVEAIAIDIEAIRREVDAKSFSARNVSIGNNQRPTVVIHAPPAVNPLVAANTTELRAA